MLGGSCVVAVAVVVMLRGVVGCFAQGKIVSASSRCRGYPQKVGSKVMKRGNYCLCAFAR